MGLSNIMSAIRKAWKKQAGTGSSAKPLQDVVPRLDGMRLVMDLPLFVRRRLHRRQDASEAPATPDEIARDIVEYVMEVVTDAQRDGASVVAFVRDGRGALERKATVHAERAKSREASIKRKRDSEQAAETQWTRMTDAQSAITERLVKLAEAGVTDLDAPPVDDEAPDVRTLRQEVLAFRAEEEEAMRLHAEASTKVQGAEAATREVPRGMYTRLQEALRDAFPDVPFLCAVADAEQLAAQWCEAGKADAVLTNDSDIMIFGAARGVVPDASKNGWQITYYDRVLQFAGVTRDQMIDVAIMAKCDYSAGAKGIGPVRALKLVKSGADYSAHLPPNVDQVRGWFKQTLSMYDDLMEAQAWAAKDAASDTKETPSESKGDACSRVSESSDADATLLKVEDAAVSEPSAKRARA